MSAPISVVVCDDVPELRQLARAVLDMLDLSMPHMDGLEAIPLTRQVAPGSEIVVFSAFEERRVAEVALRLKASRYVRKGAPLEELRDAVRDLARRAA